MLLFIKLLIRKEEHIKKIPLDFWSLWSDFEIQDTSYENLDWIHDAGATYEII